MKPSDWDWTFQVNLMGVIYGLEAFLPHIRAHGEGGAIINTASMAGHMSPPGMEAYSASKFAVVALTEGWAAQLAPENIQVQVLCPGFVRTGINQSGRNRPAKFGGPQLREIVPDDRVANGIDPARVGARVLEALQAGDLYIFTHPDMRPFVQMRFQKIMEGFDSADRSTALSGLEYRTPDLDLLP
jgi:NAD(P)-dependent dehydrogenase (short-subunit alcohol dehydrogenase family)